MVDDKNEATHIVHGPLHRHGEGPEEDWFRTLEKKGNLVLVHWWYYPDSFDSWLPQTQQFTDPEEPPEHNGPWVINARWLQDSVRFNELMNEEDYEDNDDEEEEDEEEEEEDEMEEMEEEQVKLTTTSGKKRKLGNIPTEISTPINAPSTVTTAANSEVATPETPSFKELTSAVSAEYPGFNPAQGVFTQPPLPVHNPGHQPVVHVRDIEAERPQVGSRQRKNEFEPYANGDMLNISQYTARHVDYPKRPAKKQKMEVDDGLDIPSLIKPAPCDYDEMPLPSWYDETTISEFEKLGLPEFFDESNQDLDPQDYKLCRDYMVEKYRANPDYYLTVSACKAHLEHDLLVLVRIHSFLEHNNLINNRVSVFLLYKEGASSYNSKY